MAHATTSEVKQSLDTIAARIAQARERWEDARQVILGEQQGLAAIPTLYADVIQTINSYAPSGAFETLTKDEKNRLAVEFTALRQAIEADLTALGIPF